MNGATLTEHVNWAAGSTNTLSVIIRHLKPSTTYDFTVSVSDWSAGNTSTSNLVSVTTPGSNDTQPPSVPTNVHFVRGNGCAEVWLGWNEATDGVDAQESIEYEIFVNGVLSPLPVSAGVDNDFVYGTAFGENTFTIKAVDRTGNSSAPSAEIKLFLWPC